MGKRAFALFSLAYLLALLAAAPASLLDKCLQRATGGRLVLANTGGTIWRGSATPALRVQENRFIALQPLHWSIDPFSPLGGSLKTRLHWEGPPDAPATDAVISPGRIELRHALLSLPAQVLEEASPALKPAQLRGQLHIRSDRLTISDRGVEGTATVNWQQAGSALSRITPLGDYRLALDGAGDRVHIALTTTSGALLLDGRGNWQAGRGLEFQVKARASPGSGGNLAELLHHLGPEVSPGVYGFNLGHPKR